MDPVFQIEAQALAQILDELDYFQILKVEQDATASQIKQAYHRESRTYHPDRYFSMPEGDFKKAVTRIYRRINEAWVCLRDPRKRTQYLQDVTGPDRAHKLRFTEEAEQEEKRTREAEHGLTPRGRAIFQQGLVELHSGRMQQALQSFRLALSFEPDNLHFKQKIAEVAQLAGERR